MSTIANPVNVGTPDNTQTTAGDTAPANVNPVAQGTAPASTTAPALLTMSAIRKHAIMLTYFGRDAVSDAQALIDRNQKYAPLVATLAGYAVERAQSGNANGLTRFDTFAQGLKHAQAAKLRALVGYVQGIKPAHLKSADIADYESFAQECEVCMLALVAPSESKVRATPTNWKQECLNARAERDAAIAELEALKATVKAGKVTRAPAPSETPAMV